jgi:hypothetical protein
MVQVYHGMKSDNRGVAKTRRRLPLNRQIHEK